MAKTPSAFGYYPGVVINTLAEVSIASAATVDLGSAASNNVLITGTTTITSFGTVAAGVTRRGRFSGALTLTYSATRMILPGVANITTAANHTFEAMSLGNGNWIVTSYSKANGTAISGASALVLLSTVTASTSATVDIETTFNSTYDKYVLEVTGLVPDTSNQNLKCLQKLTGTYETANYDWEIEATSPQSVTNTYRSFVERTSAAINITTTLSDSTDGVTNFTLFISVPASTTLKKYLYWYGVCNDNANVLPAKMSGVGGNTSTGALTGLRFFLSSGNILSGTFRLYGIAKS